MSPPAIRAEALAKRYSIGSGRGGSLPSRLAARVFGLARPNGSPPVDREIWALRDVSFEVARGEVIGLVGRNGAGKSTLLKILARVTSPTSGRADTYGRVGSLLEVGTGFHPELTGRENVYLAGAILGMGRAEIRRKLDAIVAFAEVERFIDTPVKRYSSGMYVRLAFSVAAHLEPDIFLVDEALAVGDLAFQQKCLAHMRDLTRRGTTIVLVSHNTVAIQTSCSRALLLEGGTLTASGTPTEVIDVYRRTLQQSPRLAGGGPATSAPGRDSTIAITHFEMAHEDGAAGWEFGFDEPIHIRIELDASVRIERPMINLGIRRGDGVTVCNFNNWYDGFEIPFLQGRCALEGWLPPLRLVPDYYETHVLVWPWGGGHGQGDLTKASPLAWERFGTFRIQGSDLNANDGVFQVPARKWRFRSDEGTLEKGAAEGA